MLLRDAIAGRRPRAFDNEANVRMVNEDDLKRAADILAALGRTSSANVLRQRVARPVSATPKPPSTPKNTLVTAVPVIQQRKGPDFSPRALTVAMIADEFTFNSFSSEFRAVAINPDNWEAELEEHNPDLLI